MTKARRQGRAGRAGGEGQEGTAGRCSSLDTGLCEHSAAQAVRRTTAFLQSLSLMTVLKRTWGVRTRGAGDSLRDLHKRGGDILAWSAEEEVDIAGPRIRAVRTHTLAAGAQME